MNIYIFAFIKDSPTSSHLAATKKKKKTVLTNSSNSNSCVFMKLN